MINDSNSPLIGVTGPDRGGGAAFLFTRLMLALAGGRAIHITPAHRRHGIVDQLDALIIGSFLVIKEPR